MCERVQTVFYRSLNFKHYIVSMLDNTNVLHYFKKTKQKIQDNPNVPDTL